MSAGDPVVGTARFAWDEGLARLSAPEPPAVARARRRIIAEVHRELRRRVGSTFMTIDLVRAYDAAPSWYLDLAATVAPRESDAWDPAVTMDAAFALYARQATDARL